MVVHYTVYLFCVRLDELFTFHPPGLTRFYYYTTICLNQDVVNKRQHSNQGCRFLRF